MTRLTLVHLTFFGGSVEPASVEFGPRLTLVRGPSDTGKSFIVDAIDFMLGANALKEIPELRGYTTALMGLVLPTGEPITLSRSVSGGNIGLYNREFRAGPLGIPDQNLSAKHNPSSESNLSTYLLTQIGLVGKRVRKNVRNDTDSLSFRNIAHLCVVDETQMQSDVSPALSGSYVSKTKEISVLKLLLQDEDDSGLIASTSKTDSSRLSGAKIEVVDRLLSDLEAQLSEVAEVDEIRAQFGRLNVAIEERSASIEKLTSDRDQIAKLRSSAQADEEATRRMLDEALALSSRFNLLLRQYDSDLARLQMIAEAGNLLGYFEAGPCAFCGAAPADQHLNDVCEGDQTYFGESVEAERRKTSLLRDDLVATLADLARQHTELRDRLMELRRASADISARLTDADRSLRPHKGDLNQLLGKRTEIERTLGLYDQVAKLEKMKVRIADESNTEAATAAAGLDLGALQEFSKQIADRLEAWGVPDGRRVRYDRGEQDIISGDQLRAAHGKGVRAILHAAFTVALGQYCLDRDIAHPGFVVLDSPLVTYRPPDSEEAGLAVGEEELNESVVAAFYDDIQRSFGGQVIIMENTDPPRELAEGTTDIPFTKLVSSGRYGFFPVPESGQQMLESNNADGRLSDPTPGE